MKKRICAALLLAAMLCTTAYAAPFADVTAQDWYSEQVDYVYEHGLMGGTSDTTFAPNVTLSRGMMLTILYRMEGEPAVSGTGFSDVEAGKWYSNAAAWAKQTGVAEGSGDGTLGHADPLTREQMAVMLYRYARLKGYDVSGGGVLSGFGDAAQVSAWAKDAMAWAVGKGLIQGAGGRLLPGGTADRGQAATVIARFHQSDWAGAETIAPQVGDLFYLVDAIPQTVVNGHDIHKVVCGGKSGVMGFAPGVGSALTKGGFYLVEKRADGHVSVATAVAVSDVDYKAPGVLVVDGQYVTMATDCMIWSIAASNGAVRAIAAADIANEDTGIVVSSDGYGYATMLYVVDADR